MDFRREKLRLSLWIMAVGMLLGLGWAAWQGWGLGRTYPYNTILYLPKIRFSDFTSVLNFCSLPSPYDDKLAVYPPGAFLLFRPLLEMGRAQGLLLFTGGTVYGSVILQNYLLGTFLKRPALRLVLAVALTGLSYPLWICLDRGNTELLLGLLIGFSLVLLRHRQMAAAAALITVAMCFKLYPILLLLLFFRKKHLKYLIGAVVAFIVFSWVSFLTFAHSPLENYRLWKENFAFFNQMYLIANGGLGGSASFWNLLKIALLTVRHAEYIGGKSGQADPAVFLSALLPVYQAAYLAMTAGLAFFVTFIEREFYRRALLLLIFTATAAPNGGDYKLVYIELALFLLVAMRSRRPRDLAVTGLLALSLVPKKELFLTYLGITDTGFRDVNIGVVLNPLCILAAIVLLLQDGWRLRIPGWGRRRFEGLISPLWKLVR